MSKLRKKMISMMERENYSPSTIKCYVHSVKDLARYYGCCPSGLSDDQVGTYLKHIRDKGCQWSTVNGFYSGIKWFYTRVLEREWNHRQLPRPRREKRLPEVLIQSRSEAAIGWGYQFETSNGIDGDVFRRFAGW